ncbi:MAG: hypothetical protein KAX38_06200 [Candidatus Krumholzibacteria bacterium]|nr:hypothetical protein [Candidatus Krumholzibacteria bacterium]
MVARLIVAIGVLTMIIAMCSSHGLNAMEELDPYTLQQVFCRFPFAKVISLDEGEAWGLLYADAYGKLYLLRSTSKGWKLEWRLANLGSKIRNFFVRDIDGDGVPEIIVATFNGRILVYSMDNYQNVWENLEDNFTHIAVMEIENIDSDPQPEFIILADSHLYIFDSLNKNHQWVSEREFEATEIIIDNIDKDDQLEIILNTGIVIDTRFYNIELEWDKPFGERIMAFDMNNDGFPEIIGEFSDYSLRIFDVYAQREVW